MGRKHGCCRQICEDCLYLNIVIFVVLVECCGRIFPVTQLGATYWAAGLNLSNEHWSCIDYPGWIMCCAHFEVCKRQAYRDSLGFRSSCGVARRKEMKCRLPYHDRPCALSFSASLEVKSSRSFGVGSFDRAFISF